MIRKRTHRMVDGVRVEGTWRPVFINNGGTYFATDLFVFADGVIDCWETFDLDGLAERLKNGKVSVDPTPDARGSQHGLASWRFSEPQSHVTRDDLLTEVADLIEELNGRPDSRQRCRAAIDRYLESRAKADLLALRNAYLEVPTHHRRSVLGDMDAKDAPIRRLCGIDHADWEAPEEPDPELTWVLNYFEERRPWSRDVPRLRPRSVDDPESDSLRFVRLTPAWYRDPDTAPPTQRLHNHFALQVTVAGATYPNLDRAYWALSVTDEAEREAIRTAEHGSAAQKIVAASQARVPDWNRVRAAVMLRLLRLKFEQHLDLSRILFETGDARIEYLHSDSNFWAQSREAGANWMGRLLELLLSELALDASDVFGSSGSVDAADGGDIG